MTGLFVFSKTVSKSTELAVHSVVLICSFVEMFLCVAAAVIAIKARSILERGDGLTDIGGMNVVAVGGGNH